MSNKRPNPIGEGLRRCERFGEFAEFQVRMRVDKRGNQRHVAKIFRIGDSPSVDGRNLSVLDFDNAVLNRPGIDGKDPPRAEAALLTPRSWQRRFTFHYGPHRMPAIVQLTRSDPDNEIKPQ